MSNGRTPHWLLILRVWYPTWMTIFLGCMALGIVPGFGIFFLVLAVVFGMMLIFGGIIKFFGWMLWGNEPNYQKLRAGGWHPYFDNLPPGINDDTLAVRAGGKPEPKTDFVPPPDWLFQCDTCGARNRGDETHCWHCGIRFVSKLELQSQANSAPVGETPEQRVARAEQVPRTNDCLAVRMGGQPEPVTSFTPPDDWLFQCNACGARNRDDAQQCWHCGIWFTNSAVVSAGSNS